jgi:hypothetical protein
VHFIFLLDDMAGTSKLTALSTVARNCTNWHILGSSLLFTRGSGKLARVHKFVTTVTLQLAVALPAVKPYISHALHVTLQD